MRIVFKKSVLFAIVFAFITLDAKNSSGYISNSDIAKIQRRYGNSAVKRAKALRSLMNSLSNSSEREKVHKVHKFFNMSRYVSDINLWGKSDYWATRMEFLGKGAGDCEDFVISKYFTLKQLGVSTKKLFFTYVKAIKYNQAHMVLTYYKTPDSIPLVIDSLINEILPATLRKDLIPVYSFNGDALFLSKQTGLGQIVPSGNKRNKKWLKLIDRIRKEGL